MRDQEQERYMFVGILNGKIMQQTPYNVIDYEAIKAHIERNKGKNTYITPNEFKQPTSRTKDNIGLLKEIFIDIDDHLSGGFTLEGAKIITAQLQDHFNRDIPTPSKIVYSGRGLHYYISLTDEKDIAKYELVARRIAAIIDNCVGQYNVLGHAEIHPDNAAIGAERFIRAEGSYNTKAKAYTTRTFESKSQYSLNDLIDNFIPTLQDISTGRKDAIKALNEATGQVYRPYRKEYTLTTWLYAALDDIKTIQTNRNSNIRLNNGKYQITGNTGTRNIMLFYFGLLCKKAYNDSLEVYESMKAFNKYYSHILDDQEVQAVYKNVMTHNYKAPRAQTLIDKLDITQDEQISLKTIISKPEVKRRKRISDSRYKSVRTAQRASKKDSIKLQARSLHLAGLSYKEIAQSLNISVGTAFNYCK